MFGLLTSILLIVFASVIYKVVPLFKLASINTKRYDYLIATVIGLIGLYILSSGFFFIADSDKSYVVQWPTGQLNTHFEPGIKVKLFGRVYEYDRVVAVATPSFVSEKGGNGKEGRDLDAYQERVSTASGTLPPPLVRFTDAAKGNAYGILRAALPLDREGLLKIHRELGSSEALINNVLKNVFRSAAIASARLMSIQEYITKKGSDFDEYFADQVANGLYKTVVQERVIDRAKPSEADQTIVDGEKIMKEHVRVDDKGRMIEEIVEIERDPDTGDVVRQGINDISRYNLQIITARITYINPEERVRKLIGDQRDAEARAALAENLRRASLLEAEAQEAEGQKQVAMARAEELAIKERQVIKTETQKAVTLIEAQKLLEQARLDKQTAETKAEAAKWYKKEQQLKGEGDAAYKRAVMLADGALDKKLATFEKVMVAGYEQMSKQKWVPNVVMGSGGGADTNGVAAFNAFMQMLTIDAAKRLGLDLTIPEGAQVKKEK